MNTLSRLGTEGTHHLHKEHPKNSTAKIILITDGEKLKAFPLKSDLRQGWFFSPLLFNIVLELLDN